MSDFAAGVIEGFFGKTWQWPARLSCAGFLRDQGFKFYVYAPKSDAHLRRRWREPLPEAVLRQLSQLSGEYRRSSLEFGIGLTPFEIYLNYDAEARTALRSKVRQLNHIGVDLLCILFDDMRGDVEDIAALQAQVIADVCSWSDAARFIVCPTYYSYDSRLRHEFGPAPKTYLQDFGRLVDPAIDIFWTGEKIISEGYTAEHLAAVADDLKRRPFIWDNHSSNDSKVRTQHLYLDPASSAWSLPKGSAAGIAFNPMNQAYLSRIALCGYQNLFALAAKSAGEDFPAICRRLCAPALAPSVIENAAAFLRTGLSGLDEKARLSLIETYQSQPSDGYASDLIDWLRGEYTFDPHCLTS